VPHSRSPLASAAFHILLALAPGKRHGYAIMRDVETMTDGSVRLAPGTLYTNIKRLLVGGLIEEVDEEGESASPDQRRRVYRLTAAGLAVVGAEVDRLEAVVARTRPWLRDASK
jgi:DNA-binding PadR family transcriptional regulator